MRGAATCCLLRGAVTALVNLRGLVAVLAGVELPGQLTSRCCWLRWHYFRSAVVRLCVARVHGINCTKAGLRKK